MIYYRNTKQMDLSDRIAIETGICRGDSFKQIAKRLLTMLLGRKLRNADVQAFDARPISNKTVN